MKRPALKKGDLVTGSKRAKVRGMAPISGLPKRGKISQQLPGTYYVQFIIGDPQEGGSLVGLVETEKSFCDHKGVGAKPRPFTVPRKWLWKIPQKTTSQKTSKPGVIFQSLDPSILSNVKKLNIINPLAKDPQKSKKIYIELAIDDSPPKDNKGRSHCYKCKKELITKGQVPYTYRVCGNVLCYWYLR